LLNLSVFAGSFYQITVIDPKKVSLYLTTNDSQNILLIGEGDSSSTVNIFSTRNRVKTLFTFSADVNVNRDSEQSIWLDCSGCPVDTMTLLDSARARPIDLDITKFKKAVSLKLHYPCKWHYQFYLGNYRTGKELGFWSSLMDEEEVSHNWIDVFLSTPWDNIKDVIRSREPQNYYSGGSR